MKPLILLLAVFAISAGVSQFSTGSGHLIFSGNLAMCVMLCLTAFGHFKFTHGMGMMMPGFVPFKIQLVYLTGVAEILLGFALLFPSLRHLAGIILVVLFILMLPANIHAAIRHINYETATYDGKGMSYLWIRIPMQALFIIWVLFFSIKK